MSVTHFDEYKEYLRAKNMFALTHTSKTEEGMENDDKNHCNDDDREVIS